MPADSPAPGGLDPEPVIVTYVEMLTPPSSPPSSAVVVQQAKRPNLDLNRALYAMVGAAYHWTDRLTWTDEQWRDLVTADGYQTWLGYVDGSPIGYLELDARQGPPSTEIAYFGLLPTFVGHGLGRPFLANAIASAWAVPGTERVWLHTCTDDHPRALPNYIDAGFTIYDQQPE